MKLANHTRGRADTKKKIAILDAVARLVENGHRYAELSVSDIVKEAGASRATFYLFFKDKSDLILELIDIFKEKFGKVNNIAIDSGSDVTRDRLRSTYIYTAKFMRQNWGLFHAINQAAQTDANIDYRYRQMILTANKQRHSVDLYVRAGVIRPDMTGPAWDAIAWMVERCLSQHVTMETAPDIVSDEQAMKMIDGLTQVVWNTLFENKDAMNA